MDLMIEADQRDSWKDAIVSNQIDSALDHGLWHMFARDLIQRNERNTRSQLAVLEQRSAGDMVINDDIVETATSGHLISRVDERSENKEKKEREVIDKCK